MCCEPGDAAYIWRGHTAFGRGPHGLRIGEGFMTKLTLQGAHGRFENSHSDSDLLEEIRLMALAEEEEAAHAAADTPRRSLLTRLFTRPAIRLAA